MTQAVIPSLVKMNVSGISVGVNGGSLPPAVPKGAFVWKYKDQSVMATWHPGNLKNKDDYFLWLRKKRQASLAKQLVKDSICHDSRHICHVFEVLLLPYQVKIENHDFG